ncbi:hypothetical protein HHK36_006041 [Tetracentron sinense]|uniref:DUF1764 domain-containing protein n=1 Tax=Tetracentron sinense TaxID=13715 RepID=A0A834ZJN8_TETSI|nr:hypothetical protein HHK36_006041 [Tetracentron sinense]
MRENPVAEQKIPSAEQRKPGREIDEIFYGKKKRKKPEVEQTEKLAEDVTAKTKKMTKKNKSKVVKDVGFVDPPSRPRKKMVDGLTIYSEEDLGIGKLDAGGTPLCPFDCSCCF